MRNCRRCHCSIVSTESRVVPGTSGHDHPLFAQQPIDQRRLAGVRAADDGDRDLRGGCGCAGPSPGCRRAPVRRPRRHRGRGARAVRGSRLTISSSSSPTPWPCSALTSRIGSKPELIELERAGARAPIVGLVDGQDRRHVRAADRGGNVLVAGHQSFAAVDDEDDHVGGVDAPAARARRPVGAADPARRQTSRRCRSARTRGPARRPDGSARRGWSRDGRHDGAPRTGQPVEQRGLAHVGTADEHDGGQTLGWHGGSALSYRLTRACGS